jgi:hypothetical protein
LLEETANLPKEKMWLHKSFMQGLVYHDNTIHVRIMADPQCQDEGAAKPFSLIHDVMRGLPKWCPSRDPRMTSS